MAIPKHVVPKPPINRHLAAVHFMEALLARHGVLGVTPGEAATIAKAAYVYADAIADAAEARK